MFALNLTDSAKKRIEQLCSENQVYAVQLGIKSGGCAGFEYEWKFAEQENCNSKDELILLREGKLLVKENAKPYLYNCKVDYTETLFSQVFEIKNPNTVSECGCGISLTFDERLLDNNIEILELK